MSVNSNDKSSNVIGKTVNSTLNGITAKVTSAAYKSSSELRNSLLHVVRGQRSGRRYRIPHTKRFYTASAPGEPPAVRTGMFRLSWYTNVRIERNGKTLRVVSAIESNMKAGKYLLGDILEDGTSKMAPRPYKQKVIDRAMPKIMAIYKGMNNS